jgi:hypothetical protein
MNISLYFTHVFETKFKRYKKKFNSIESDLKLFTDNLPKIESDDLGGGIYKYRLRVKSKNKGKSAGFRIITFEIIVSENRKNITLLTLYDKSEQSSISKKEIAAILKDEGLV